MELARQFDDCASPRAGRRYRQFPPAARKLLENQETSTPLPPGEGQGVRVVCSRRCPMSPRSHGPGSRQRFEARNWGIWRKWTTTGSHFVESTSRGSATGSGLPGIADTSQSAPPKPQTLLDSAVRAVEKLRQFISARIKQQGELFGHQITGEGRYYELRQGPIPTDPSRVDRGSRFGFHQSRAGLQWRDLLDLSEAAQRGIVVQARRRAGDHRTGTGRRQAAARSRRLLAGTGRAGTFDARAERPVRVHFGSSPINWAACRSGSLAADGSRHNWPDFCRTRKRQSKRADRWI